jgi:hypothetical protein
MDDDFNVLLMSGEEVTLTITDDEGNELTITIDAEDLVVAELLDIVVSAAVPPGISVDSQDAVVFDGDLAGVITCKDTPVDAGDGTDLYTVGGDGSFGITEAEEGKALIEALREIPGVVAIPKLTFDSSGLTDEKGLILVDVTRNDGDSVEDAYLFVWDGSNRIYETIQTTFFGDPGEGTTIKGGGLDVLSSLTFFAKDAGIYTITLTLVEFVDNVIDTKAANRVIAVGSVTVTIGDVAVEFAQGKFPGVTVDTDDFTGTVPGTSYDLEDVKTIKDEPTEEVGNIKLYTIGGDGTGPMADGQAILDALREIPGAVTPGVPEPITIDCGPTGLDLNGTERGLVLVNVTTTDGDLDDAFLFVWDGTDRVYEMVAGGFFGDPGAGTQIVGGLDSFSSPTFFASTAGTYTITFTLIEWDTDFDTTMSAKKVLAVGSVDVVITNAEKIDFTTENPGVVVDDGDLSTFTQLEDFDFPGGKHPEAPVGQNYEVFFTEFTGGTATDDAAQFISDLQEVDGVVKVTADLSSVLGNVSSTDTGLLKISVYKDGVLMDADAADASGVFLLRHSGYDGYIFDALRTGFLGNQVGGTVIIDSAAWDLSNYELTFFAAEVGVYTIKIELVAWEGNVDDTLAEGAILATGSVDVDVVVEP